MRVLTLCGLLLAAPWAAVGAPAVYEPANVTPPKPMREFRAAWVASVANIDWPSAKGLSTAEQKAELIAILDRASRLRLNTVILQVRPACDALYASEIEPWSEFLTGTAGKAPAPFYDPLTFAIDEAHKRGIELHAWFNPFRAGHPSAKTPLPSRHVARQHPQWVKRYGSKVWLDPGEPEAQEYSLSVVMDVVHRYDIDGVHFDDYFYPYKETTGSGRELEFPDEASWQKFGAGGKLSRDDWRRENVNRFIERVYRGIKSSKPAVKFGVSPFGIWRPKNPPQIQGFDAYDQLYADSKKWLHKGWVDYFAPQLYWAVDPPEQSFPVLFKWWEQQNSKGRHIFPGLDDTKTVAGRNSRGEPSWKSAEIVRQVEITRKQDSSPGHIHWNMTSLMRNSSLNETLLQTVYVQPALVPAYSWLDSTPPSKPSIVVSPEQTTSGNRMLKVDWSNGGPEKAWLWVVQSRSGQWKTEIVPSHKTSWTWRGDLPDVVAISAIDRCGNSSAAAVLKAQR